MPGGYDDFANSKYSLAAGRQARALHTGTFVWADWAAADFESTADNQFLIRADGGVGIGTNDPGDYSLSVNGKARVKIEQSGPDWYESYYPPSHE